jgi:hypothetical protein
MNEVDMRTCKHEIFPASSCMSCKAESMPTVYVSGGGMKYHARRDCTALIDGQSKAANPEEVKPVSLGSEIAQGKKPCKTCKPPVA